MLQAAGGPGRKCPPVPATQGSLEQSGGRNATPRWSEEAVVSRPGDSRGSRGLPSRPLSHCFYLCELGAGMLAALTRYPEPLTPTPGPPCTGKGAGLPQWHRLTPFPGLSPVPPQVTASHQAREECGVPEVSIPPIQQPHRSTAAPPAACPALTLSVDLLLCSVLDNPQAAQSTGRPSR